MKKWLTIRHRVILVSCLLAVFMVGGWYAWRWFTTPMPPAVDLAGADPEVAAAVEAVRANVLRAPRAAMAWGKLGQVLVAHSYFPEANSCFCEAERLDPNDVRWPYLHGITLIFSDSEAALAAFDRAVQLRGNEPVLRVRLAETLLGQGRADEAEVHFRQLLKLDPRNPRGQLGLGRLAFLRGDLYTAREQLTLAAASPFTRKSAYVLLAELEQRAGNRDDAARELHQVNSLPDDPDWPDSFVEDVDRLRVGKQARLDHAAKLLSQNRTGEAFVLLRGLARDYPDWDRIWLILGQVLMEQQDLRAAEDALRNAIRLGPGLVEAHFYLGAVLFRQGNNAAAGDCFRAAIKLKPHYDRAHYNLGHCLKQQGNRSGAIEAFRAALRCRLGFAEAHTNLGELLAQAGDKAAALAHLRQARDLNPDDEMAKKLLAQLTNQQ